MQQKRKKITDWVLDKFLGSFLSGTILLLVKVYIDLPTEKKNFFQFDWVYLFLSYPVKLWVVLAIVLLLLFMLALFNDRLKQEKAITLNHESIYKKKYIRYRVDIFGTNKAKWTWAYSQSNTTGLSIKEITPLCPICEAKMNIENMLDPKALAICSKCRLEGREKYTHQLLQKIEDIESEIMRRIENNEYETPHKVSLFSNKSIWIFLTVTFSLLFILLISKKFFNEKSKKSQDIKTLKNKIELVETKQEESTKRYKDNLYQNGYEYKADSTMMSIQLNSLKDSLRKIIK